MRAQGAGGGSHNHRSSWVWQGLPRHHEEEASARFPSGEIQRLQEQNASLRNAVAQMRAEMEALSEQALPPARPAGDTAASGTPADAAPGELSEESSLSPGSERCMSLHSHRLQGRGLMSVLYIGENLLISDGEERSEGCSVPPEQGQCPAGAASSAPHPVQGGPWKVLAPSC